MMIMMVIGVLLLFICDVNCTPCEGCFSSVTKRTTTPVTTSARDPLSGHNFPKAGCPWNNEAFIRENFKRTCSQELLMQVKQSVDNISALLTLNKSSEPTPTCGDADQKHQLVSALTERCIPLLIQQNLKSREDGRDFFNRSWAEFKVGFNDTRGNYWLGNDLLSQLTLNGRYKLKFELQSYANFNWYYAEYRSFVVLGEAINYLMHLGGYSGNAGQNSFQIHDGMMFTTYDRDNDQTSSNCAQTSRSGFWFKSCSGQGSLVNVNGVSRNFIWYGLPGGEALHATRMWLLCQ